MGLRGPKPKPTALRQLEGAGHWRLNQNEPQPRKRKPRCPDYIKCDPVALACWKYYEPVLMRMKVLTEADGLTLANLCVVHSCLIASMEKVREMNAISKFGMGGMVTVTQSGQIKKNQLYENLQSAIDRETQLCRELGLTPSSRARLQIASEQKAPENGLLRKPRPKIERSVINAEATVMPSGSSSVN